MTLRIVLASRNPGKLRELGALLAGLPVELLLASEAGAPEVPEDGATFEENAAAKARETARATGLDALADDSGLEVPALDGAPGVRSARYSPEGTDAANNLRLRGEIARLRLHRPAARFVCVVAFAAPDGEVLNLSRGEAAGYLLPEPRGRNGFGYDPLFFSPELSKTFAEATPEEKAGVSHRGRALRAFRAFLEPRLIHP
ncbi:MAG: RdgB/HAM1 family non-canonical purine NTP pyrophosphatase [Planctomycetes bacterium]|nr:RdgB/HAM1 family non-canonical purine NTP pyrophosphatase [Planctomycetota bacterium]